MPPIKQKQAVPLAQLVSELDACTGPIDEATARRLLTTTTVSLADIAPYIEERPGQGYSRRAVARRDNYELLVLTWTPGQASVAHDHAGSLCGLRVMQGQLTETLYATGPDGQVRKTSASHHNPGEITLDPGVVVHSLGNAGDGTLVTLHLYSPPLPEVRRYAVTDRPPAAVFTRKPAANAKTVAIVGGGFTGSMTLANLLRFSHENATPLHVILIDRQPAVAEGIAYRTNDMRHLLNVPAGRMSCWPDRPEDFFNYCKSKDANAQPGDFISRKTYGQYVRHTLLEQAANAPAYVSVELLRDEATSLARDGENAWAIGTVKGREIRADAAVLTVGHRPPDDPFQKTWHGPRSRFVADPWAALVLSQIAPDESVLLMGSGLTAVDAMLTLDRPDRTAPVLVVSRRGLMPMPHAKGPVHPTDVVAMVAKWLDPKTTLTAKALLKDLRAQIALEAKNGNDWRQVIDALRPSIQKLWTKLPLSERSRFITHLRPFWEVHRHRMPAAVCDKLAKAQKAGRIEIIPGGLTQARADNEGVNVTLSRRTLKVNRTGRVSWVINCTGPGIQGRRSTHPILKTLLENNTLADDELGLGLLTNDNGQALNPEGQVVPNLLIAGTLRKATLWESTAVPELRGQAQSAATTLLATLAAK